MPVQLIGNANRRAFVAGAKVTSEVEFDRSGVRSIHVGLINNMPDGALEATERQFLTLIDSAAVGMAVQVSIYALPDAPRSKSGQEYIDRCYSGIEHLWDAHLDGLIVTGAEPKHRNLAEEPYWNHLTRVLDWAESETHSTVLSCLAAHAAIQHIDGIARRPLADKRFGLFECSRASNHPLLEGAPSHILVPHSRWNDVPENDLLNAGYTVLTRSKDGGVDTFVKKRKSLLVFFQGHPEYDANALLLEYRRDIGRYLRHETDRYPSMPDGYFDSGMRDRLTALRHRYVSERRHDLLDDFPLAEAAKGIASTWSQPATGIYRNWLSYVWTQKEQRLRNKPSTKHVENARTTDLALPAAAARAR